MTRFRAPLIPCLILPLLTLACGIPLGRGPNAPTLGRKVVVSKVEPNTLVAGDDTRCTVSAEKFARTERGENAWCAWGVSHRPPRRGSSLTLR